MAVKHELEVESEVAKSYVLNNQDMDDDYKKELVKLIDISVMATNGISQEEKIQHITESIAKLALLQVGLIKSIKTTIVQTMKEQNGDINEKIVAAINESNKNHCKDCKAMKHAIQVEQKDRQLKIIEDYKNQMGITDDQDQGNKSWSYVVKTMLMKPYIYIVGSILLFSPYGVEIVKSILNFYSK